MRLTILPRFPLLPLRHLLSLELRLPLLQKCLCSFAHVFRRARQSKQRCFEKQSLFLRHLHAPLDRFHDVFHGERRVRDYLFRQRLSRGQKLHWFINMVHQADALSLFRADHFSRKAKFVRDAFAAKARQPLRPSITRNNSKLHFRLPQSRSLAGQTNRASECNLATPAEREAIDRANRRLTHCLEQMQNSLPEKREFLSAHRRLPRQFPDVRSSDELFFSRARKNQRTHARIVTRIQQRALKLFNRLPVQRVQHFRPVESDERDSVSLFVQNIFVSHLRRCLSFSPLAARTSSPLAFADPNNRKIRALPCAHSTRQEPCASAAAAARNAAREIHRT